MSATERPDAAGGGDPPEPTGVPAVLAMAGLFVIVLAIVGLVALGGWVALVCAVVLMIAGVLVVTRCVETISWTRRPPEQLRRSLGGVNDELAEDLAITDDAYSDVSVHDVPLDSPERRAIAERYERAAPTRPPSSERREPLVQRGESGGRGAGREGRATRR